MTTNDKQRCEHIMLNPRTKIEHKCNYFAITEHKGKHYCKVHDPIEMDITRQMKKLEREGRY